MKYGEQEIKNAKLELWPNPEPKRRYTVKIEFPEFTCLCPRSGYPDFATIKLEYQPVKHIVELRSLKLWLNSFRDRHISHEAAANAIYFEIEKKARPRVLRVEAEFSVRGGAKTTIIVT